MVKIGGGEMRQYHIYLIEEEFASHYFGRESKIYQLFLEYEKMSCEKKALLRQQIDFVTRPIPSLKIHQILEAYLTKRVDYTMRRNVHALQIRNLQSEAQLVVHDRYILLEASGSFEAETMFFEILRKYDSCFLAMDFTANRYGWLNPIKERKFV